MPLLIFLTGIGPGIGFVSDTLFFYVMVTSGVELLKISHPCFRAIGELIG